MAANREQELPPILPECALLLGKVPDELPPTRGSNNNGSRAHPIQTHSRSNPATDRPAELDIRAFVTRVPILK
jgi:hypothetical protein